MVCTGVKARCFGLRLDFAVGFLLIFLAGARTCMVTKCASWLGFCPSLAEYAATIVIFDLIFSVSYR